MGVEVPYIGYVVNQGGMKRRTHMGSATNKKNIAAVLSALSWLEKQSQEIIMTSPPGSERLHGQSVIHRRNGLPLVFEADSEDRSELSSLVEDLAGFTLVVPSWRNALLYPESDHVTRSIWDPNHTGHQIEVLWVHSRRYPLRDCPQFRRMGIRSYLQANSSDTQMKLDQWRVSQFVR